MSNLESIYARNNVIRLRAILSELESIRRDHQDLSGLLSAQSIVRMAVRRLEARLCHDDQTAPR